MDTVTIRLVNVVGDEFCTTADDGQNVFEQIKKALKEHKKVNISFLNVRFLTTAFLNTAIGQLYRDFDEETLRNALSTSDITNVDKIRLKRVVDTAKLFYKDPNALLKRINEILEEEEEGNDEK